MGLTIAQKIIQAHLVEGEMIAGQEIALRMDQTLTQVIRHPIRLSETALDHKIAVFHGVFRDLIVIQTPILPFTCRIDNTFGDIHDLSGVVFQLVSIHHHRECLSRLHE